MRAEFLFLIVIGVGMSAAAQPYQTNHNAALILGRTDFTATGSSGSTGQNNFLNPDGIAVDPATGQIYIGDSGWHRILRFAPFGSLSNGANATEVIGQLNFTSSGAATSAARLRNPAHLRIGPGEELLVADTLNHRVSIFLNAATLQAGDLFSHYFGQSGSTQNTPGTANDKMNNPGGVLQHLGNLWVADTTNNRVLRFTGYKDLANGAAADLVLGQDAFNIGSSGTGANRMAGPNDLALGPDGSLWVCDSSNHRILRFANIDSLVTGASAVGVLGQADFSTVTSGTTASKFFGPTAIAVTSSGRLYVADGNNRRVVWFNNAHAKPDGAAADGVIGQSNFTTQESVAARNRFTYVDGIALDASERLYVTDSFGRRVLVFAPSPEISVRGKSRVSTGKSRITLRGSASALAGFQAVQWRVNRAGWQSASGTSVWSAKVKLKTGRNTVFLRTLDRAGMFSGERAVRIRRS